MTEFEVIFYEKENGDCPVEEFMAATLPECYISSIMREI